MIDHKRNIAAMRWRGKLEPTFIIPGTAPVGVTSATCRRIITHFFETGRSNHSGTGSTLWVILDYLQRAKIPYTMRAQAGFGYEVIAADWGS